MLLGPHLSGGAFPGEEDFIGARVHFCATCDGPFYRGQDVLVVGGGNSVSEEAIFLTKFDCVRHCPRERASLSKAFKRVFGESRGDYRRERARSPIRIAEVNAAEPAGQAVTAAKNGWGWPVSA